MNRSPYSANIRLTARKQIFIFVFSMIRQRKKLVFIYSFAEKSLPANFYIPD